MGLRLFGKVGTMTDSEDIKTWHFSLGQGHTHRVNGMTWDCDLLIEIDGTFASAREKMFSLVGDQWGFQYEKGEVDVQRFFPRGVHRVE
jgi:hypothetical protein